MTTTATTPRVLDRAAFYGKIDYSPHREQLLYHNSKARFRIPVCGRRFGKDVALDTPILTTTGWATMASIAIGDYIYTPSGETASVVAKSEVMYNRCYEVTFDDGSSLIAGEGHEWAIETYTMRKSRGNGRWFVPEYKVMTTQELETRFIKGLKYPDSIMLTQPVQMSETKPAVDPYVWGVWLGDGTTGQAQLTAHTDDMPTYLAEFEKVGYSLRDIPSKQYGWKIVGLVKGDCLVKQAGDEYRLGSIRQRLALLQGLMDTDGTVSNEQMQFDNKNKDLVALVIYLVNSLGGKTRIYSHQLDGETYWRAGFNIAIPVFRLQRKVDKQMRLKQGPQTVRRYIKKIERVETVPTQCIQVDRDDGLWLAGTDLVVTHNSTMAGHDLEPKLFMPKKMFWIVGPTYDLAEKEFRVIWDSLIIRMQMGRDKRFKKAYNKKQGNMFIEFPWGTRLECRSADHPENLVGEALDWVIMSEAAKHKVDTWERFIRPALTDKRGGADFPTTPEGFNWLHNIWQLGQNPDFQNYASWSFPSWANTVVYPGGRNDPEIIEVERTSQPEWFAQEYGADFASFVGKIFPEWDEKLHVKKVEFDPNLPNYMAFDFGYTNPLAAVEFQIGSNDEIRVWREHYKSFTTVNDHIDILKNRDHPEGYHLDLAFGDPADPEAAATISRDFVPCIVMPEVKSEYTWKNGIDLIRSFMKPIPQGIGDTIVVVDEFGTPAPDQPRFWVDYSCTHVIRENNNYRSKEPIKGQNVPEFGTKMEDHTIDALRYALIYIFKLGAISSLADIYRPGSGWRPEANTTNSTPVTLGSEIGSGLESSGFGNMNGMEF